MPIDPWLPRGHALPDGSTARAAVLGGEAWQIVETAERARMLIVQEALATRWIDAGLLAEYQCLPFAFGPQQLCCVPGSVGGLLAPVAECPSPSRTAAAMAFARALKATRALDRDSPLQDALYVEKLARLLPTYSAPQRMPDDVLLGLWLTGGVLVSVTSFRRVSQMLSWMSPGDLKEVAAAAGITVVDDLVHDAPGAGPPGRATAGKSAGGGLAAGVAFALPGRPTVAAFFNEHVIDIIRNGERYRALGIGFPGAVVLHGPPGCGKTFAVEKLIDFLGWPSFQIDAASVASPYIHETSRKVAAVFESAAEKAPAVVVIDEMEAFLAERDMGAGSSHHRVEEVAEFLRRIPEAAKARVLVIAMTNRIDMIDPAILRRGRFDHVIKMEPASEEEVLGLLESLCAALPQQGKIDCAPFARQLAGRPLSDVGFLMREAARLAARGGRDTLDVESMTAALQSVLTRADPDAPKIGFRLG
jgi:hypothetical protein